MKRKWWRVVLGVAFVLMVLCAVRDVRRPIASRGAPRIEVRAGRAPSDEKKTDARFPKATESLDENDAKAADELHRRQLEAAGEPQRMRQQVHTSAQTPVPPAGQ
jgi:hypothetical protein